MSQKEVIHKQTFQNSKEVLELVWRSKPKPIYAPKMKSNFVRDCALKKELDRIETNKNGKENIPNKPIRNKEESSRPPKPASKNHVLPPNTSYADLFLSCSNRSGEESISRCDPSFLHKDNVEKDCRKLKRRQRTIHDRVTKFSHVRNSRRTNKEHTRENKDLDQVGPTHANVSIQCNSHMFQKQTLIEDLDQQTPSGEKANHQMQEEITNEQTHSPFGESALLQLMQIRDKLRSRGQSEDSEAINIIDAFIEAQGSGPLTKNAHPIKIHKSVPDSVSTPNSVFYPPPSDAAQGGCKPNCVNERKVLELAQQLAKQQATIDQLGYLSAELLSQHNQLKKEIEQGKIDAEAARKTDESPTVSPPPDVGEQDVHPQNGGGGGSVEEQPQAAVHKALVSENEALLKKVKHYNDMIVKLEFRLKEQESHRPPTSSKELAPQREDVVPSAPPSAPTEDTPNSLPRGDVGFDDQRPPSYSDAPPLIVESPQQFSDQEHRQSYLNPPPATFLPKPESDFDSAFGDGTFSRGTSRSSPFAHPLQEGAPIQDPLRKGHGLAHSGHRSRVRSYAVSAALLNKKEECDLSCHDSDAVDILHNLSVSRFSEREFSSKSDDETSGKVCPAHFSKKSSLSAVDVRQSLSSFRVTDSIVLHPSKHLESTRVNTAAVDQAAVNLGTRGSKEESNLVSLVPEETYT